MQVGFSYTWSHALDEQSALGLFYNGNNPLDLRDGFASPDFDRPHEINFQYDLRVPEIFRKNSLEGKLVDGWALIGLTTLDSGQPYSVVDYTGAVGSLYYSVFDGVTNPIVPLSPNCTPKSATTGHSGAFGPGDEALNAACFTVPLLAPGALNGAVPGNDAFETGYASRQRNIFRQAFQKRADASLEKEFAVHEGYNLRYTFDVYNLTNTASFDVPNDNVSQNQDYNNYPVAGTTPLPSGCGTANPTTTSFYNCPGGLGTTTHTIGSPRQIQMSLRLLF